MAAILVILPAGTVPPPLPESVETRVCATAAEVAGALAGATGDVVLCLDGLDGDMAAVARAAAAVDGTVIEVAQDAWDGETHSDVRAACAGVIAGFGGVGIAAAVALLGDGD